MVISVQNVTRYYAERRAVDDISFNVAQGQIVGFLGPNGAGKTTTMRMLTGYLMPSSGEVRIGGYSTASQSLEARRLIGYLPETVPLYADMTTRAYLSFAARLRGLDRKRTRNRVDDVIAICRLEDYADVLLGKLSKGFRQRVGLAQAIVHDPPVLILDEPTVGIDPIQVAQTKDMIRALGRDRTILLSTHVLPEVSLLCERVIILHAGRIVAEDRIENLSAVLRGGKRLRLTIQGPAAAVTERLGGIAALLGVTYRQPHHIVEFQADREPQADIMAAVVAGGWTLLAMDSEDMSLEDIFLQFTAGGGTAR